MDHVYLQRLSADIRQLVEEIERSIESEIRVTIDPNRARGVEGERDPLACNADEDGAEILIPAQDAFLESAVLHELLHIQRFLVYQIPKLVVCDDAWDSDNVDLDRLMQLEHGLHDLDNNLEHLLIVPKEIQWRPERKEWWASRMERSCRQLAEGRFGNHVDRDNHAFTIWLFLRHVLKDDRLEAGVRQILASANLLNRAGDLLERFLTVRESKEAVSRLWLGAIGLPLDHVCLEYTNIHERRKNEFPLTNGD